MRPERSGFPGEAVSAAWHEQPCVKPPSLISVEQALERFVFGEAVGQAVNFRWAVDEQLRDAVCDFAANARLIELSRSRNSRNNPTAPGKGALQVGTQLVAERDAVGDQVTAGAVGTGPVPAVTRRHLGCISDPEDHRHENGAPVSGGWCLRRSGTDGRRRSPLMRPVAE
ncbi:hypothetical protein [Actinosynnema sp. NPDC023587]|uniref:hypothetical protein n=1 Tax=Actinosynnema sp. NPDC023587 TaxID=3154695 RepID=UPI0033C52A13